MKSLSCNNELIFCGLYILLKGNKFFWIHSGDTTKMTIHSDKSLLEIVFQPELNSYEVGKILGLETRGAPMKLRSMSIPERFKTTTVSLNGLRLRKLTYDPHTIRVILVSDHESRVCQEYDHTTIVVSKDDINDREFWEYVFFSGGLDFLSPDIAKINFSKDWKPRNYPRIVVANKDLDLESTSEVIYSLRSQYDRYLIRSIDYQDQFFAELRKRLEPYGIDLVRWNREETLSRTSYISYRIQETPSSYMRPRNDETMENVLSKKCPIYFEFRTINAQMFYDFKNKFTNVNLVSDLVEYRTTDKYGCRWTSAVKWGKITEDFNHLYEMDSNSNYSYQCSFTCELYFYEAYDTTVEFIEEINLELETVDQNDKF